MKKLRKDYELPESIVDWDWNFHHLGIPTDKIMPNERYLPEYKMYVSGFNTSPFGVEWIRFENNSPVSKLIQTVPHLAFEVNDLDYELANRNFNILSPASIISEGIKVAMIEHNGAPIELLEFEKDK